MAQIRLHGRKALIIQQFYSLPNLLVGEFVRERKKRPYGWSAERWQKQMLEKI